MPTERFETNETAPYSRVVRQYASSTRPDEITRTTASWPSYSYKGYRTSNRTPRYNDPDRVGPIKPLAFEYSLEEYSLMSGHSARVTPEIQPGKPGYLQSSATGPQYSTVVVQRPTGASVDKTAPTDMDSMCRNSLLLKIKGSAINLGVVAAERKRTATMVGNTAMNLVKAMRNLRRGNFTAAAEDLGVPPRKRGRSRFNKDYAKRGAKAVAGGWLALQYGWKPLLTDIYGACETLARRNEAPMYVTVRKKVNRVTPYSEFSQTKSQDQVTTKLVDGLKTTTVRYGVTFYKPQVPSSSLAQLGISNPALIAWELVPYSFVVDWFLPIGDWLGTFDATLGLTFYSGYRTVYSKLEWDRYESRRGRYSNYVDDHMYQGGFTEVFVKRTPLTGFPSPAIPRFKNPVSTGHLLNALALLVQNFKR